MELSPFILIAFLGAAAAVESLRARREERNKPRRGPEPTPNQRQAFIRVYNEFYN